MLVDAAVCIASLPRAKEGIMFRALKSYFRRRRMARWGLAPEIAVPTWTAGERSGVWTLYAAPLGPGSVVYSCGVGDNITWDLALIAEFGCAVHAFDPTPASREWIGRQKLPTAFHFHPVGVAAQSGMLRFGRKETGRGVNYRAVQNGIHLPLTGMVNVPVKRLGELMAELGHLHIDLLKLDIEGCEYETLADLLGEGLDVRQILIEFHHHYAGIGLGRTIAAVAALRAAGYQLFHISSRGYEMSFLRASGYQ